MSTTYFRFLGTSIANHFKFLDEGPKGPKLLADFLQTVRYFSVHRFYFEVFKFFHLIQLNFGGRSKADGRWNTLLQAAPTHKA